MSLAELFERITLETVCQFSDPSPLLSTDVFTNCACIHRSHPTASLLTAQGPTSLVH